jgi:hypothetical protein
MESISTCFTPDIVLGACDQKISPDEIMRLLENTFLNK